MQLDLKLKRAEAIKIEMAALEEKLSHLVGLPFNPTDTRLQLTHQGPDAEAGDAKAQYYLGLLHGHGCGVPKNPAAAADWFRKAAEQGMAEAQVERGHLYRRGEGVPRDDLKAVDWWQKAADQGDTFAQSSLAGMYLDGNGVEKSLIQAYKWTVLAEPRQPGQLVRWNWFSVRRIAKMMKPAELAKAQKLVKEWLRAQRK